MKKIKILIALLAISIASCENDGGESKLELQDGAIPNLTKISTTDSFINLVNVNSGATINLGLKIDKGLGDIASMNVIGFYKKGNSTEKAVLKSNITEFPTNVNFTQTDLINAFSTLNNASDFGLGNSLTISTEITLTDGRVVKVLKDDGTASVGGGVDNIFQSKFVTKQVYDVSCPSSLAGTYAYVTTNCYTPGPPAGNAAGPFTGTVTLTGTGGTYAISDASFGGWIGLYGPGNIATGVKLKDVCNKISYSGVDQYNEVFLFSNLVITGNQMSFHWENDYGEYGDTVLTNPNGNWPPLFL